MVKLIHHNHQKDNHCLSWWWSTFSGRCNLCSFFLVTFCRQSYFPTDWCWWWWADPDFRLFVYSKPTSQGRPTPQKNSPSNQPCIQIALKSGPPQIGVELRPNLVLKSGQKGAKKAICGDPELPCEHECVHVLSSFFPSIGALAPRDRDGVTSEAKYRFNMFGSFLAHTCMQPLCHRPSTKMAHFLATKKQLNEKRQIIRKWKRGGEGDFSEVPIGVLDFGDRNSCP